MKKLLSSTFAALLMFSQAPVSAQAAPDPLLFSFGTVTAQSLFTTYMAIAELGDLWAHKAYDGAKVKQVAGPFKSFATSAQDALNKVAASGKLSSEDAEFAKQAAEANGLLAQTAGALMTVADDDTPANRNAFEENRKKTWAYISNMLGIK